MPHSTSTHSPNSLPAVRGSTLPGSNTSASTPCSASSMCGRASEASGDLRLTPLPSSAAPATDAPAEEAPAPGGDTVVERCFPLAARRLCALVHTDASAKNWMMLMHAFGLRVCVDWPNATCAP